jgi:uncharacterized membrane protein
MLAAHQVLMVALGVGLAVAYARAIWWSVKKIYALDMWIRTRPIARWIYYFRERRWLKRQPKQPDLPYR